MHLTISYAVLEIPKGLPVRGRQLWRRARNFLLIFLQFYAYDLRFKPWGPTTFLTEFQTLVICKAVAICSGFKPLTEPMLLIDRQFNESWSRHCNITRTKTQTFFIYKKYFCKIRHVQLFYLTSFNTLRQRQNGHHFPDDMLKYIFLYEVCA